MNKAHQTSTSCSSPSQCDALTQPFPFKGKLGVNSNLTLRSLLNQIGRPAAKCYSYVLTTVELNSHDTSFEQVGSAPNFQGGYLTLCTCKHRMRTYQSASEWKETWIAGFTSRSIFNGCHWLFYLAKVEHAYESHADIWHALPESTRRAKAADKHFLGDLFEPKKDLVGESRFDPRNYVAPSYHAHRQTKCSTGWHGDIRYKHRDKYGNPAMLVGDSKQTFIWYKPLIYFDGDHPRTKKWCDISDLLQHLASP